MNGANASTSTAIPWHRSHRKRTYRLGSDKVDVQLQDFHDASLDTAVVDWPSGRFVVKLRTSRHGQVDVVVTEVTEVTEVTRVVIPRVQDWGRSVSVNSLTLPSDGELAIEMQSGDVISASGATVSFETGTLPTTSTKS
jgi:hypothetical protein